jgi:hypothetical protein
MAQVAPAGTVTVTTVSVVTPQAGGNGWMIRSPGQGTCCTCGEIGWHFGAFDGCCNGGCCGLNGCNGCLCRYLCSSCMYGRAVSMALGENCFCCSFAYCILCCLCCIRGKIKARYGISGGGCCCDWICCDCWFPCAICQIVEEVNYREGVHIGCCGDPNGTGAIVCDCNTGQTAMSQYSRASTVITTQQMTR